MTSLEDGDKDGRTRSDFMIELTYIFYVINFDKNLNFDERNARRDDEAKALP